MKPYHHQSPRYHLRPTIYILLYLPLVLLTAAIIAPWLYFALAETLPYPFHRYINRLYLIAAILWLPLLLYLLKIKSPKSLGWNLDPPHQPWSHILLALTVALITAAAAITLHALLKWHLATPQLFTLTTLTIGLLPALIIAPIEEILFRGVAQHAFSQSLSPLLTCIVTAAFFSFLHFIKVPPWPSEKPITALSGIQALSETTSQAFITCFTQSRGFGLFIAGLCLSWLRNHSGSLWLPIGLHAGWILAQKAFMHAFETTPQTPILAQDLLSSPIAWIAMILSTIVITHLTPKPTSSPH